ncbi:MAG: ANTAR domain-containing protein, partial [Catenulispora sp.]
ADAAALSLLDLGSDGDDSYVDPRPGASHQPQVHQATGMIKMQLGVSIDNAFLMLRARAFTTSRSLQEVATDVVERRLRFTGEDE